MRLADRASSLLAPGGPISRAMPGFEPRAAQVQMARAVAETLEQGGTLLMEAPTGCHIAGQQILMSDGTLKRVEDIRAGDLLMGPDSHPRQVLRTVRGHGPLVRIVPRKGEPFIVNIDHILSLVRIYGTRIRRRGGSRVTSTRLKGWIVDVSVREWLTWPQYRKHIHKLFRSSIEFPDRHEPLPLDPYFLGIMLGDGSMIYSATVTTADHEIISACHEAASVIGIGVRVTEKKNNAAVTVHLPRLVGGRRPSPLLRLLKQLGLRGASASTKFVPEAYKTCSRTERAQLLAGLLDTDGGLFGGVFDFISRSPALAQDTAFVARSLGLAAYIRPCQKHNQYGRGGLYYRVSISGDLSVIPCRVERKTAHPRRQIKNVMHTGFSVETAGEGEYFGFALDGDGRYLMGDFTVTHNTGKSLSYLAALGAYLTHRPDAKAVASTATITLQEQLVHKDLVVISEANGVLPVALLKGMGRYLCLLKWRGLSQELSLIPQADLESFGRWVAFTKSGDQNELPFVPSWWGEVAADHGDCLGPACSLQLQCFALRAKEAARRAQLLVTNHHLLLLYRRFAGSSTSPLPNTAPVVIDEAHHLADFATEVYGESCSDFALVALAQRLHGLAPSSKDPLHMQIDAALAVHRGVMNAIRPKGFEPMAIPALDRTLREGYLESLRRLSGDIGRREWDVIRDRSGTSANERAAILIRMLDGYTAAVQSILEPVTGTASWVEPVQQRNVKIVLRNAPIDVGGSLGGLFGEGAAPTILCSATLAAGGSFAHLKAKLGIQKARELILPPAFNYQAQMRYYLPRTPLDPKQREFTDQVASELLGLLRASEGRALVLFTSYEQLRAIAERLRGRLPYTLLVQDQGSTSQLLQRFKEDVHSVLLATARFWEGVDIVGEALSLLVICRLPFDVPTHPLAGARFEAAKARGENPFTTVAVPEAIIRLRQGVGRLIRSTSDRGVVAILDGRVLTKSFGRRFLSSIPAGPYLSSHDEVTAFLRRAAVGTARR